MSRPYLFGQQGAGIRGGRFSKEDTRRAAHATLERRQKQQAATAARPDSYRFRMEPRRKTSKRHIVKVVKLGRNVFSFIIGTVLQMELCLSCFIFKPLLFRSYRECNTFVNLSVPFAVLSSLEPRDKCCILEHNSTNRRRCKENYSVL